MEAAPKSFFGRAAVVRPLLVVVLLAAMGEVMAYESNYPPTAPGTVEVKTLPAGRVLETAGDHPGVENQNGAFMTLFRYLKKNDLAMTVPVETDPQPSRMRFFVARQHASELPSTSSVSVLERPARTVVSLGIRGSYSEDRFQKGVEKLRAWLREHPEWRAAGEPYAVYWNGPFVPGFLKRSEVHIPLEKTGPAPS